MKMADILRNLADKLDGIEQGGEADQPSNIDQTAEPEEQELDPNPVMVPPLQAKLEILKKSEGMPSVYDNSDTVNSELAMIKKNAGLSAAQHEASEDNDVLG